MVGNARGTLVRTEAAVGAENTSNPTLDELKVKTLVFIGPKKKKKKRAQVMAVLTLKTQDRGLVGRM